MDPLKGISIPQGKTEQEIDKEVADFQRELQDKRENELKQERMARDKKKKEQQKMTEHLA